jgi:hypothetical protein
LVRRYIAEHANKPGGGNIAKGIYERKVRNDEVTYYIRYQFKAIGADGNGKFRCLIPAARAAAPDVIGFSLATSIASPGFLWRFASATGVTATNTRHELHEAVREVIARFPVYRTYIRAEAG